MFCRDNLQSHSIWRISHLERWSPYRREWRQNVAHVDEKWIRYEFVVFFRSTVEFWENTFGRPQTRSKNVSCFRADNTVTTAKPATSCKWKTGQGKNVRGPIEKALDVAEWRTAWRRKKFDFCIRIQVNLAIFSHTHTHTHRNIATKNNIPNFRKI